MTRYESTHAGLALVLLLAVIPTATAGTGAAELSLDRNAVLGLIEAALPEPLRLEVAGMPLTLRFERPGRPSFLDGGVEASVRVGLDELDWQTELRVRWVPETGSIDGTVRLRAESAIADLPVPVEIDLATFLPEVELPRRLDLGVDGPGGRPLDVVCLIHGVEIEDERLVVRLGLLTRGARPVPRPQASP